MCSGARGGLDLVWRMHFRRLLAPLDADDRMAGHHRLAAVRCLPERRHLRARGARLG